MAEFGDFILAWRRERCD